jgi:hypothetical protein
MGKSHIIPRTPEQQAAADEMEREFHEMRGLGRYTYQELADRAKAGIPLKKLPPEMTP